MVMAASTAAIGRLKKGRMLPSDLMSEVTKALCVPKISFVLIDDRIAYPGAMRALLGFILAILVSLFKSISRLEAENACSFLSGPVRLAAWVEGVNW
jgi:hypothetical protein